MIRVISEKPTGEILLDEALRMIKATPESISIGDWIDYMSGLFLFSRDTSNRCN